MKAFLSDFKKSKAGAFLITCLVCASLMCFAAFAADGDVDVNTIMSDTVSSVAKTLMSGLGIVVTGIVGFIGAKIAVVKLVGFLKTMTGK